MIEFFISLLEALNVLLRILKEPLLVPVRVGRQDLMELRWLLVMPDNLRLLRHMMYNMLDRLNHTVRQIHLLNKVRPVVVLFKVTEIHVVITPRSVVVVIRVIVMMRMTMSYILIFTLRLIFIVRAIVRNRVAAMFSLLDNVHRHVDVYFLMHRLVLSTSVSMASLLIRLLILFRLLVLVLLSFFMLGLFIFFGVRRDAICNAV